jgi:hypothetical protein
MEMNSGNNLNEPGRGITLKVSRELPKQANTLISAFQDSEHGNVLIQPTLFIYKIVRQQIHV